MNTRLYLICETKKKKRKAYWEVEEGESEVRGHMSVLKLKVNLNHLKNSMVRIKFLRL